MKTLKGAFNNLTVQDWLALILLFLYILIFSALTIRQHQSFNTNALDLAKFDQSIWNTSQGRPYQISIGEDLVIASHFSPALALFAPVYWLWPDIRALFILQSILIGGAGFLIYWFFRKDNPWLGIIVFAAFLMQPAVHQINLIEFRRLTLAVFATSWAIYHLLRRQYRWMALGLLLALLSKEDMSLTVVMIGVYIFFWQKEWKVGAATLIFGGFWLLLIPFGLLPSLMTQDQSEGYQHAVSYFDYLGDSLPEIIQTATTRPELFLEFVGRGERLHALFNLFWPSAFLFLLAPQLALLMVPHLALLLASTSDAMGTFQGWYPSILIILLFWAVAVGISKINGLWQKIALLILLSASLIGWMTMSRLWPGERFDRQRYQISQHDSKVADLLQSIPDDASVMAQDSIVPHLSHRQEIHLFPWNRSVDPPQFIILDQELRPYPLKPDSYRSAFFDILASNSYIIERQFDSFYIFKYVGQDIPQIKTEEIWDDALRLKGLSIAAALPNQEFGQLADDLPLGTNLRVTLYWQVESELGQNYTVFVHALNSENQVVGQNDSWPADSHRPTSVLSVGEQVRDVHFISLNEPMKLEDLSLRIGLYEAINAKAILDSEGRPYLQIFPP